MPPKTDKGRREAAEVAAFIDELYKIGGYESWAQMAREAQVLPASLSDWKRGENAPSGYNLVGLIETTRRVLETRGETGQLAEVVPLAPRDQPGRPRDTEEAVAAVVQEMRKGFAQIARRLQRLEKQRTPEEAPARAAAVKTK